MNTLRTVARYAYMNTLFLRPHDNVYMFHHVSSKPKIALSGCVLDTQKFKRFILQHELYLSIPDICEKKEVSGISSITFDDGLEDVYEVAFPFLIENRIPFTIFVLSSKLDLPGYLKKSQLCEMAFNPLVTIGSHGIEHVKFSQITEEQQRQEIFNSKESIEQIIGKSCEYIAYPFGEYNEITLRLVEEAGYKKAFAVEGRPVYSWRGNTQYYISRLSIEDSTLKYYGRL